MGVFLHTKKCIDIVLGNIKLCESNNFNRFMVGSEYIEIVTVSEGGQHGREIKKSATGILRGEG